MQPPIGGITVPIQIANLPDLACAQITNFAEAIIALSKYGSVEIPSSVSNVIIGFSEPTEDDITKVWFRYDVNGNFIGIYAFQNGNWQPVVPTSGGDVFWKYRSTNTPFNGFQLIDDIGPSFVPSTVRTWLQTFYLYDPTSTFYTYAAYAFVGY